jgi:hypothetical protein
MESIVKSGFRLKGSGSGARDRIGGGVGNQGNVWRDLPRKGGGAIAAFGDAPLTTSAMPGPDAADR